MNINLKTGETYNISDIINLDDGFMDAWLTSAKKEVGDDFVMFTDFDKEDFKGIMMGDAAYNADYGRAFFLDQDGAEFGFSYHHMSESSGEAKIGWLTAPFTYDELEKYKTDSKFWDLLS